MSYGFWARESQLFKNFNAFVKRFHIGRKVTIALIFLAFVCGIATYYAFTQSGFGTLNSTSLLLLLNVDLIILLSLGLIIAKHLAKLWLARRTGQTAAKLHTRFVVLFSLLTITPAIVMTVFSVFIFNLGLQKWFSDHIRTSLAESTKVAEAYLEEHKKVISASVYTMARDIAQEFRFLEQNPELFNQALDLHAEARNLDEALVFNAVPEIEVIARSKLSFALEFEVVSLLELERAQSGVVIKTNDRGDRVRALIRISPNIDAYLLVGRIVDPAVSKRIADVKNAVSNYYDLEREQNKVQLYFMLMFMAVALLLLLTAIWVALIFANRIATPIGDLISTAEKVGQGDLSARVTPSSDEDEIASLMYAFNKMTAQLDEQKGKLIEANRFIDYRRRFIEDVLEGVTSGIISLDSNQGVQVMNLAAAQLLDIPVSEAVGKKLARVFPEVKDLLTELKEQGSHTTGQIKILRKGALHTLLVRIVSEQEEGQSQGHIITFSDITELMSAQRKAAWADMARRIAHEIRNPLTPIQLSAEHLNRKYLKQITHEPEKFQSCVETIIRQVSHLGDMVREFSAFARLPEPKMKKEDLIKLIDQHVDQYQLANPQIVFETSTQDIKTFPFMCDAAQISQVFSNLFQNSIDSINEYFSKEEKDIKKRGKISISLEIENTSFSVIVKDNGTGFPQGDRDALTEPYVTKKKKGTGLGLAIVKKIIEDHGGTLTLENASRRGALVKMTFLYRHNIPLPSRIHGT